MNNLYFNLVCAVCLAAISSAEAVTALAESDSFQLITGSSIVARTVEGDSVYVAALDETEGVPMVDGVAISGWSSSNPYWDTTSVSNGTHLLTYGNITVRLIVENADGTPMDEGESFCLELRKESAGRVVHGTVRIAPASETTPSIDGEQLAGWSADAPSWDSTAVADGWHTLTDGSQSVKLLVLNNPKIAIHGGALEDDELWSSEKLHLVQHWVRAPEDTKLTIAPYTVVKFLSDTGVVGSCESSYAVPIDYSSEDVTLYCTDDNSQKTMEVTDSGMRFADATLSSYELHVPSTPSLRKVDGTGEDTSSALFGKLGVYYTTDGTEPTLSSKKLAINEAGDGYDPIKFTIAPKNRAVNVRLAWLEERSGAGNMLFEPNWGVMEAGKALRSVSYQVEFKSDAIPVVLNGENAEPVNVGASAQITTNKGLFNGECLWRASDVGCELFTGWTKAVCYTATNVEHPLDNITTASLSQPTLAFTAPLDAASIELASATAAMPQVTAYFTLNDNTQYTLKTIEGESVCLNVYVFTDKVVDELTIKPSFAESIDATLAAACDVEYCLTAGNDDDSSSAFGYDTYAYSVLGALDEVLADGAKLSVAAVVASDEDAIRKAPRLLLRIRDRDTGVTFGYSLNTFCCANYVVVNGKPVFAEPGTVIQLDPRDYLPSGNTLTGWSAASGTVIAFDSDSGKIAITIPSDGTQATITLDSTARTLDYPQISWNVQLNKGWNLISTGLYKLDGVSLEKFTALNPRIYVDGIYTPMREYLPAHAYWVYSDEEQNLQLSGFAAGARD